MMPALMLAPMDSDKRAELVERIAGVLQSAVSGSVVALRGSLAGGTADEFSDIDLLWEVPDEDFAIAVRCVGGYLAEVQPIQSIRIDPDFARSSMRRLVYVRFTHVPLFWRVDLDIMARSVGRDEHYDGDNPGARDDSAWSLTESALMNAVAAVRALGRNEGALASDLLRRGYERIDLEPPRFASFRSIRELARQAARNGVTVRALAAQVEDLVERVLVNDEAVGP